MTHKNLGINDEKFIKNFVNESLICHKITSDINKLENSSDYKIKKVDFEKIKDKLDCGTAFIY